MDYLQMTAPCGLDCLCLIRKMGLEAWARDKAASVRQTYFHQGWRL